MFNPRFSGDNKNPIVHAFYKMLVELATSCILLYLFWRRKNTIDASVQTDVIPETPSSPMSVVQDFEDYFGEYLETSPLKIKNK
jgi:hypothetical protein